MANKQTTSISVESAADLSAKTNQGKVLKLTAANVCNVAGVAGELCIGILANSPKAGDMAEVDVGHIVEALAGGTITAGQKLTGNAAGKLVTAASTNHVHGIAIDSATVDQKFRMLWNPTGILA